jgi:signal transduction histidine kinase
MNIRAASSHAGNQRLLGEMLHSLCQPLTSLRCLLEQSVRGERALQPAAMEQADAAIRMVRLMREYLDLETGDTEKHFVPLMPVLRSLVEDLASVALVKGVHLDITGSSDSTIQVEEPRLRLALQYIIQDVVDRQSGGNRVILLVRDDASATVVQAQGKLTVRHFGVVQGLQSSSSSAASGRSNEWDCESEGSIIRRGRLAIATQVLVNAGAEVKLDWDQPSFVVRFPR